MAEAIELSSICKICSKTKTYKTKLGHKKGLHTPCMSCSNSIKLGGKGKYIANNKCHCPKCDKDLQIEEFHIRKDGKPYAYCKSCHNFASHNYHKETYRYSRHNINKEQYDNMLLLQDNKCWTCKGILLSPHVDHCHKTGKVRGLLCGSCNRALGLIKENIETLENLINYIKESKKDESI